MTRLQFYTCVNVRLVLCLAGESMALEDVLCTECDILVPAAIGGVIDADMAAKVSTSATSVIKNLLIRTYAQWAGTIARRIQCSAATLSSGAVA